MHRGKGFTPQLHCKNGLTDTLYDLVKNNERARKIIEALSLVNDDKLIKKIFEEQRKRSISKLTELKKFQSEEVRYDKDPIIKFALESAKSMSIETLMISNANWLFLWDVLEATFLNNIRTQNELKKLVDALGKKEPDREKAIERLAVRLAEQEDKVKDVSKYQKDVEWLHRFFEHEKTDSR